MIVEYIRYHIDDGRKPQFERAYADAGAVLTASPHCAAFELACCVEEPSSYVLRIEWDSVDGHLRGFRASPEFRQFLASIQPYVADIAEMRHYAVSPVTWRRAGA